MFLLPPFIRQYLRERQKGRTTRVFLQDEQVVVKIKEIAVTQRRAEQEVYDDIITAGIQALKDKDQYIALWDTLSPREQQVAALTCLGYSSYEMADKLSISYDTVRTHSKHIYDKFGLKRKELRLALQSWDFQEWLETHRM